MRRCDGCFESLRDDLEICPFCGYYDGSADSSVYLVPGTVLSGRYKIGNLIESDETCAKYLAFDTTSQAKVEIKEYLPKSCAIRDEQSHNVLPNPEKESQFNSGFQAFVDDAKRLFADASSVKIFDCIAENSTAYMIMEHVDVKTSSEEAKKASVAPPKEENKVVNKRKTDTVHKSRINKRTIGIVVAVSLVIVLIGVGIYIAFNKLSRGLAPSSYAYLSDGQYQYMPYLNSKEPVNFDSLKSDDYTSGNLVQFSPDGKYIYYFTRIDDDDYVGTLCRIETGKIKSNFNADRYIETISSNVKLRMDILDDGSVLFKKEEGTLCYFDGKEVIKIAKEVSSYYVSEDNKQLLYLVQDDSRDYYYGYTMYGCNFKNLDDKIKLASDIYAISNCDDFDNIIYERVSDEDETSLYCVGFSKSSDKIANNAVYLGSDGNKTYYAAETDTVSLYSFVKDSSPDSYSYTREALKDSYYDRSIYCFYLYENGESTLICKNVLSFCRYSGLVAYNTTDMVKKKIDIDDVESLNDIFNIININYSESFNILPLNSVTPIPMTSQGTELLELSKDHENYNASYYISLVLLEDRLFLVNDKDELYVASISNKAIGQFDYVADDVFYSWVSDGSFYYRKGQYEINDTEYFDQYVYKNGKSVKIAWDCNSPKIYEDDVVIAYTDLRSTSKKTYYEITMFYTNGDKIKIADDVNWYIRVDKKNILYISDGDLYRYDGKEKTRIATDVDYVWCSKYMEYI